MKKLFLTLSLCSVALAASAQLKSVDVKWDVRGLDMGFGAGINYLLGEQFEFAPALNFVFPDRDTHIFTVEADMHYLLDEYREDVEMYPIFGVGMYYRSKDMEEYEKVNKEVLINAGFGARWNFHDQWALFAEEKLQYVDGFSNHFFGAGLSYRF